MDKKQLRNTLMLMACAFIWGTAFVAQSVGSDYMGPYTFLASRSWLACAFLLGLMAVLLAVSLTACSPKQVAQDMVVHLVHKLGLVEESDEDDTDTTTKAPAGGSVEFPAEMDTTAARVVTYPVEDTLYVSFNGIANRSTEYFVAGGDSMTVTGYATTEASNEKYMYFKIAFWELSDDKTMTSYVPDSTIYYCADGADYQYNVTGLTAGKQYKITISYDNGNKYYVTGGLKVEGLGSTELNTYGDDTTTG